MLCGRVSLLTNTTRDPLGTVIVRGETPADVMVNVSAFPGPPGDGPDGDDPPPQVEHRQTMAAIQDERRHTAARGSRETRGARIVRGTT